MRPAVAGQYGRMDHPRHAADLYETPPEAVEMLLRHVPCRAQCSNRVLVGERSSERCAVAGWRYMRPTSMTMEQNPRSGSRQGFDFLSMKSMSGCRSIVMNPPFKDAEAHVRHALQLLPDRGTLAVLLRMTWIAAKGRADLLKHCHTAIIVGRHVGCDIHFCMLTTLAILS